MVEMEKFPKCKAALIVTTKKLLITVATLMLKEYQQEEEDENFKMPAAEDLITIEQAETAMNAMLEHNHRSLYDFFDGYNFFIGVTEQHKLFTAQVLDVVISGDSRKEVEEKIFSRTFAMLEQDL